MKIEISQALAERIRRNDKTLEGAEAVISRALRALERVEKIPAAPRQESSSILNGALNGSDLRQIKHGWKATLIEIMRTLGHRRDLFNTFPSRMLKRGRVDRKNYIYVEEADVSVPGLSIDRAQRIIEQMGHHFNLDIMIVYEDKNGNKRTLRTEMQQGEHRLYRESR